jgi:hypothetical protein
MTQMPRSIGEVDADWLRGAVGPEDAPAFRGLVSVAAERVAEAAATSTEIYRLVLSYADGAPRGPVSLIAKLPSSNPEARAVARGWSTYEREVQFYRSVAATVGIRIPRGYVAEFDPGTYWFVLVMEDLAPAVDGNQVVGLSLEQARLALGAGGGFLRTWWYRSVLAGL